MFKRVLIVFALLATAGCDASLPGDYSVRHGDRGKAWLRNPDGTITGGLIKELYRDDRHILLVTYPLMDDGAADTMPIDHTCYVALLIDAPERRAQQIHIADAIRRAARMSVVERYDRPCLKGMPNSPS